MDPVAAPGVYQGVANVIAAVMLLIEFGMLRQALARDQIRLYAAQSALISVLAIVIAARMAYQAAGASSATRSGRAAGLGVPVARSSRLRPAGSGSTRVSAKPSTATPAVSSSVPRSPSEVIVDRRDNEAPGHGILLTRLNVISLSGFACQVAGGHEAGQQRGPGA
jgi:hypothetical protein